MGLRELFNKESKCEKCGHTLPKKQLAIYDTTHQGQNKNGHTIKVCNDCLMELFYRDLRTFNEPAIVISPIKGFNAYVTYNFNSLLNAKQRSRSIEEDNKKFVDDLMELLPQKDTKCSCCGNKATYTWCPPEIFNNDPFSWEVIKDSEFEHIYLCKDCLVREFQKKMAEADIRFEVLYPPLQGVGFLCSWEV
jgi:hypothetical protein